MSPNQSIKSSDLDKSNMKHDGLLNKHICEEKTTTNISNETTETVNFRFSHYKSMETISCHSNQSSYPTGIKNKFCRGYCLKQVCQVSASSSLWFQRRRFLNLFFFENLPFILPRQLIKLRDLDKSRMKRGGLLNKHFKNKSNIPNDSAEIVNFHFFHYKSIETISCHSNQSSYPTGIKKKHKVSFLLLVDAMYEGRSIIS